MFAKGKVSEESVQGGESRKVGWCIMVRVYDEAQFLKTR